MTPKDAFDKWTRANDRLNAASVAHHNAQFDFRTAETQFHNAVALNGPQLFDGHVYWIEKGQLTYRDATVEEISTGQPIGVVNSKS